MPKNRPRGRNAVDKFAGRFKMDVFNWLVHPLIVSKACGTRQCQLAFLRPTGRAKPNGITLAAPTSHHFCKPRL